MKIDIFNHIFPQTFFDRYIEKGLPDIGKRVKAMPTIVNLDARFKVMDEFGEYCQVISLPAPPIEALGGPNDTPDIARLANDGMAELCRKHRQRFPTFIASLPMVAELPCRHDRAMTDTIRWRHHQPRSNP